MTRATTRCDVVAVSSWRPGRPATKPNFLPALVIRKRVSSGLRLTFLASVATSALTAAGSMTGTEPWGPATSSSQARTRLLLNVQCRPPSATVTGRAICATATLVPRTSTSLLLDSSVTGVDAVSIGAVADGSARTGASAAASLPWSTAIPVVSGVMTRRRPTNATEAGVGARRLAAA